MCPSEEYETVHAATNYDLSTGNVKAAAMPSIVPPSLPDAATATPTVSALIETLQAAPEVRSPWLTAAIPVYNPYCSCKLART